jgi:hypothetical protein
MLARAWFAITIAWMTGACATGNPVLPRDPDAGPRDAGGARDVTSERDAWSGICEPPCRAPERCVAGTCVPPSDDDRDGIDGRIDCDDHDPTVGAIAERSCEGPCGSGVQRCEDGVWEGCSAPTDCTCEPGAPARMIPCERCGVQRQICVAGRWQNDGPCTGSGPCSPGDIGTGGACGNCGVERRTCGMDCSWGPWACEGEGVCAAGTTQTEMQSCGACGTGTQIRTRTCRADCSWSEWSPWGTCVSGGSGLCTPGETQTETRACGNCMLGTQTRTRTCDPTTCSWGAWSAWSTCSGGGACAPGDMRPCPNGDPCGVQVCTTSCTWPTACTPSPGSECLRIRPGTSGPPGNNYRCCTRSGADPTGWQFCLPPDSMGRCFWSTTCDPTTAC